MTYKQFNTSLFSFLDRRATVRFDNDGDWSSLSDIHSSWLALLFAVLACGVQFSNDPIKERDLRTKVFSMFMLDNFMLTGAKSINQSVPPSSVSALQTSSSIPI